MKLWVLRHNLSFYKEKTITWLWSLVPNRVLYWAVITAWARATTSTYDDKHPDEVTWTMMMNYLKQRKSE